MNKCNFLWITLGLAGFTAPAAYGQDAARGSAAAPVLEEIVVTARKRSEDLQSVPVAVSAFQGKFLDDQFTRTVNDLEHFTPNVKLATNQYVGGGLTAAIRGVGFADLEKSFEPAVAVSVDGQFLANNTGATIDSFDIASVEILRGPQGTLFGRNTIGGTINITRTRPTGAWGIKASADYSSYNNKQLKVIANAPLIKDVLALKVGAYVSKGDAFTTNLLTGARDPGISRVSFTSALLLTPTDAFEALLSYDHLNDKSHYPKAINLTLPGSPTAPTFCNLLGACKSGSYDKVAPNDFKKSLGSTPFYSPLSSDSLSLKMTYKSSWFDLESVTGYIKVDDSLSEENTGSPDFNLALLGLAGSVPVYTAQRANTADQFSQEIRMTSKLDGRFNYVAGAYYFHSSYTLDPGDSLVLGSLVQHLAAGQTVKSYAGFAETYWDIAAHTRLTAGARYTRETKDLHTRITSYNTQAPPPFPSTTLICPDLSLSAANPAFAACRDPSVTFSKVTPRISLDYKITPDAMVYATWSRGFRSGGWNGRATTQTSIGPYAPETVDNYEAGVRTEWLDHRLRLNLTVFDEKYKNKQEEVLSPSPNGPVGALETVVKNAAAATIRGVELEVTALPVDNVTLYGSAGYLDAKYDQFLQFNPASAQTIDITKTRNLRDAPKYSANVGGNWKLPAPSLDGRIVLSGNYGWRDKFFSSPARDTSGLNRDILPAYGSFDASLGYERDLANGRSTFKTSAYVNDAFHSGGRLTRTLDVGVFYFGAVAQARTVGINLQYEY